MSAMFKGAMNRCDNIKLNLSGWNTSNVTKMSEMFSTFGLYTDASFEIIGLDNWDVSNITTMNSMFYYAGCNAAEKWSIGNIVSWDTSSVTDMSNMFAYAGSDAGSEASQPIDLSGWKVPLVTSYANFNYYAESLITPPTWVN